MKILLIEDDNVLRVQLKNHLLAADFKVDTSGDGEDGLYRALEFHYDLAIIDIGLPKMSGMEVITALRQQKKDIPILILTARSGWQDKVHGLNAGADDYLVKPFQTEELIARLHAMLRRAAGFSQNEIQYGPLSLNLQTQIVQLNQQEVALTAFEYKMAEYLFTHANKVVSKAALMDYLYDDSDDKDANVIEVLMRRLRQKIDPNGEIKPIETLRGRGYRFTLKATL
jgi:two-component system response regulator PhoP